MNRPNKTLFLFVITLFFFTGCGGDGVISDSEPVFVAYSADKVLKEKFGEVIRYDYEDGTGEDTVLFSVETKYDSFGNMTAFTTFDEWGNYNYGSEMDYTATNRVTNKQVYYYGEPAYREEYEYYDSGKLKSYRYYLGSDQLLAESDYIYDDDTVTKTYYLGDGQQSWKEVLTYNKYGSLSEYTAYNETNVPFYRYSYDYDRYGTVTEEKEYRYYEIDGEWTEKCTAETVYEIRYW